MLDTFAKCGTGGKYKSTFPQLRRHTKIRLSYTCVDNVIFQNVVLCLASLSFISSLFLFVPPPLLFWLSFLPSQVCSDSTIRGIDGILLREVCFFCQLTVILLLFRLFLLCGVEGLHLSNRHQELPRILLLMARPERLALAGPESGDLLRGRADFVPSSLNHDMLSGMRLVAKYGDKVST